jgi:hypothetical protein
MWFDDSTLRGKLVVVVRCGEFPKVLNSRLNPDHRLLGTHFCSFQVFENSTIQRIMGESYFGVKSFEDSKYHS